MTKYKVKYKSSTGLAQQHRKRVLHVSLLGLCVGAVVAGVVFGCVRLNDVASHPKRMEKVVTKVAKVDKKRDVQYEKVERVATEHSDMHQLQRMRLNREEIPPLNFRTVSYSRLFCDMNEEQLCAAKKNGIHHLASSEILSNSDELVHIYNNGLYRIDTLTYSKPYLVPEASLMLDYIALRFKEVVKERGVDNHDYRIVVTSVLRSEEDVLKLRRYNRNATENSCHCYGTTIDISYIRFLRDDGEIVNELWLKEALATALYELRYEGICYVKYEFRQCCFHITVRDTEYRGTLAATMHEYGMEHEHQELLADNTPTEKKKMEVQSEYVQY